MTEPNMKSTSSKSSEKNFSCVKENTKLELAVLGNLKNESTHNITNVEENVTNPFQFTFPTMHTKEVSHISCDAITQATSPYVPSISSTASFNESISRSEILTFATNYNASSSSDTRSVPIDTVNRCDPPSILNRVPQLSIEETFDQEQLNPPSMGNSSINQTRQLRQTWSFRKSLCCFLPINEEIGTLPHSSGAPPTYSATYTGPSGVPQTELSVARTHILGDRRYFFPPINHSSFVAPTPPPSYAQAQGISFGSYSVEQNISVSPSNNSWPPRSIAAICPRCIALIVTTTEIRRSVMTHLSAFLLCLCGCWPCCMIPYCLDSCKSIDHYCPVCRTYLGTYTPL